MAKAPVPVGLIGAGRIGRLHADHLQNRLPGADLRVVADANPEAARACAEAFRVSRLTADYREVVADPEVRAVIVCSPTNTHAEVIEAAAAAGKHIFCEKPVEVELGRIDRALAAVERAGVILQVGFNRRFDPNFQRIRRAVAEDEIGTPHQLHIISRDPAPPPIEYVRQSGGIFLDMTIHDFDMARFLIGDEVEEIFAIGGVRVDPAIGEAGDLDTVTLTLKFAGGAVGVIENCRQAVYGYDQRVEVFGSGGSIRTDNNFPNACLVADAQAVRRDLPLNFFLERYTQSYLEEMSQFLAAVAAGGPSPLAGPEARVPVVMAFAARRSSEQGRPVKLAEVETPAGAA